tara:strand:- start:2328 stop:2996 length:669 start_codon:yes stop_codon:yes gene_type:complete
MDEVGNRTLTFDRVAARIGHDQAKRYVQKNQEPRGTTEQSLAATENSVMQLGGPVPVLPAQLHGAHLEIHLPVAQQFINAVVGGQLDPVSEIKTLQAIGAHVLQHAQAIASDPGQQDMVAQALDVSNKLQQIIENTERSIEANGGQEGGDPEQGLDPKAQAALELSRVKQQILQEESAVRMQIKESEARQKQQLEDFSAAARQQREANREQVNALAEPFGDL